MAETAAVAGWVVVSVAVLFGLYRLGSRRSALAVRLGIAIMVIDHVQNGLHALVSPASFYRSLPGSRGVADTFTLTLVRDLGAARLTLALVLSLAAVLMDQRVLAVAFAAATLSGVIRLLDHLAGVRAEEWMNWFGYTVAAVLPVFLWAISRRGNEHARVQVSDTA